MAALPDSWLRDYGSVFHPAGVAPQLQALCEPLLQLSQLVAVLIVVGGLAMRLRDDEVQLEGIASMMIRVAFIASVAWWRGLVLESTEAATDAAGTRLVPGATLSTEMGSADRRALGPLQEKLGRLAAHWGPASSPVLEVLEEARPPTQGREDEWLARGWNWARAGHLESSPADQAWGAAAGASKASLLHAITMGVGAVARLTIIAGYLAECLRLLLFHAGFALLPVLIAGLGTDSLRGPCLSGMLRLAGISLWPLGWAFSNAASLGMLDGGLDLLGKTAQSALYPKLADESLRSIALAAPHLSWALTGSLAAMSLGICLWCLLALILPPWLVQRSLGKAPGG